MLKRFIVILAALAMSGVANAAKPPQVPMPLGENHPVEVVLEQQEVGVDVPATDAMAAGGGLLGALIVAGLDNKKTKEAEATIVPIRDLLIAYRFNESMEREIRAAVPSPGISQAPTFNFVASSLDQIDAQSKQALPERALVLKPRYSFDTDFTELKVNINAQWVERSVKTNGKVKAKIVFSRNYTTHMRLANPGNDKLNVNEWVALGGPRLTQLFEDGVRQSVAMLVYDFSADGRAKWGTGGRRGSLEQVARDANHGGGQYEWQRIGKGMLEALNANQTLPSTAVDASPAASAPPGTP